MLSSEPISPVAKASFADTNADNRLSLIFYSDKVHDPRGCHSNTHFTTSASWAAAFTRPALQDPLLNPNPGHFRLIAASHVDWPKIPLLGLSSQRAPEPGA